MAPHDSMAKHFWESLKMSAFLDCAYNIAGQLFALDMDL